MKLSLGHTALILIGLGLPNTFAGQPDTDGLKLFEQKVRPVLLESCIKCHGADKQKGQLRLDTLEHSLKGGETGPAIVPGDLTKSLLIAAVNHAEEDLAMPPKEDKLSENIRAGLSEWVKAGAPWPKGVTLVPGKIAKRKILTDKDRAFWSYQPVKKPAVPALEDKNILNEIDRFVLEKLKPLKLSIADAADRRALIRRASLDLHGMNPSPEEVEAFADDKSPNAYEKLIDRLLASPRYGERYGRHWLDLVRYAESDGFRQDAFRPNAWPYRDYVIKSFNLDKAYDRFVTEQLAGDELEPDNPEVYAGTAFLRLSCYEYNQRDVPRAWDEYLNDVTDVCGDVFLGTSLSCARCHDHKFDPILQADYYRFQAFFSGIKWQDHRPVSSPDKLAEYNSALKKWEDKTATIRAKIAEIEKPVMVNVVKGAIGKFAPEFQDILNKAEDQRTPWELQIAALANRQVYDEKKGIDGKIKTDREKWAALKRELAEFDNDKPKELQTMPMVTDLGTKAATTWLGGDRKREEIEPGFLSVLDPKPAQILPVKVPNTTGRRSTLAAWITDPNNPLTARVMANRLWQYHFGRGLVPTSSNYGTLGEKPSHPELLDWLAARFVADGWSMKKLNKLIMMSATYQQDSRVTMSETAKLNDPENKLLWRMCARRLDAQQIRDAMLSVSGELDNKTGGPSSDLSSKSRGIYTKVLRNTQDPLLAVFDEPDGFFSVATRNNTTTATQALFLINGQWPLQRAEAFAARLQASKPYDDEATVINAYKIAYGRPPVEKERMAALAFLKRGKNKPTQIVGQKPAPDTKAVESAPAPEQVAVPVVATAAKPSARNQYYQSQPMPHRGGQAAFFRENTPEDQLKLSNSKKIPTGDFTIEAVVLLESLYENANVRVIASRWDGKHEHEGWSFGITSEKSRHQPRNLILQFAHGDAAKTVEVIVSDLRIELHAPHYVAASVKLSETGESGITFYMRDLSDADAILKNANVKHNFTGPFTTAAAFSIGGRDATNSMGWHGLIDDVRLSNEALSKEELFVNDGERKTAYAGYWRFEETPGFFKDTQSIQTDLVTAAPGKSSGKSAAESGTKSGADAPAPKPSGNKALVDFCHALLNSSEFLYSE